VKKDVAIWHGTPAPQRNANQECRKTDACQLRKALETDHANDRDIPPLETDHADNQEGS